VPELPDYHYHLDVFVCIGYYHILYINVSISVHDIEQFRCGGDSCCFRSFFIFRVIFFAFSL